MKLRAVLTSLLLLVFLPPCLFAVNEGDAAPDFSHPVLGGDSHLTLSETHGMVRYIDFWASWCGPCRVSIPQIIALQEELGGKYFMVIGINVDERVEDALAFLGRYAMNYVNVSDPQGHTAAAYALRGMPMSFVVDPAGYVTLAHTGFRRGDMDSIRLHILESLERLRARER